MAIDWILGYRDGIPWIGLTLSIWGFLCGVIAITGGVLVLTRPPVGGILLLLGSIGSLGNTVMLFFTGGFLVTPIEIFMMYSFIAGLLLIPGAVLALADYQSRSVARIVTLVLGISAGLIGAFGVYGGIPVVPGGFLASGVLLSTMGIAGAVLTRGRPAAAGALMLVSGIGGFTAALILRVFAVELSVVHYLHTTATVTREAGIFCMAYAIAGLLLIPGAVLALASRKKRPREG